MAPKPVKKAKKVTTGRKKRNEDGSSSSQPPRFTSRDNETWWEERKETSFIIEKTIDPTIDNYFKLSNAFATLGWANMLTLTGTYFPELVREFYANITEKSKKRFLVRSYIRGMEVEIDLTYLREFLDLRDPSHPIHYMINRKGVVVDDRGYNIEETKGKFGVRDMLTRSFGLRWIRARLLIYLIGFNIVPRASGLNEIRNSDLYLVDRLIFGLPRIQKIALAPIIIKCIREVVASSRRDKNFVFPVLLSRIFIAQGVNTEGAEQRSTTQSDVLDHNKMSTLRYQFIDGAWRVNPDYHRMPTPDEETIIFPAGSNGRRKNTFPSRDNGDPMADLETGSEEDNEEEEEGKVARRRPRPRQSLRTMVDGLDQRVHTLEEGMHEVLHYMRRWAANNNISPPRRENDENLA